MDIVAQPVTMAKDGVYWDDQAGEYAVYVAGELVTWCRDHGAGNNIYREQSETRRRNNRGNGWGGQCDA